MTMALFNNISLDPVQNLASNVGNQAGVNQFGIDRNSRNFAVDTQAALTRAQWDQARGTLAPIIDRLSGMYFNPSGRKDAQERAGILTENSFAQARGAFDRNAASTGMALAPDQRVELDRQFANQGQIALIDARNRAGRGYDDMRDMIALGS